METLISPEQIPEWIPGTLTHDSENRDWNGLSLKGYRYAESDVEIPQMRDYMIVVYENAKARMSRRSGGAWQHETVGSGMISLLTRAEQSQWAWTQPIDVSHIYLSHDAIRDVAGEVYDRDIEDIEIFDRVRAADSVLPSISQVLKAELNNGAIGGALMVDTLRIHCCVHLLREYAQTKFIKPRASGLFKPSERRVIDEYIFTNISHGFSIAEMAAELGLSAFHFSRKFKADYGMPPHKFIMQERVRMAEELLTGTTNPLKEIAAKTGFSDQSHMTRTFSLCKGITPARFRRSQ